MVILFDMYHLPDDVFEVVFATKQQIIVSKVLVKEMKKNSSKMTKSEMSAFATKLHDGDYITELDMPEYKGKKVRLSYNKRQFYDRILTPMRGMGLIGYDLYKKIYQLSDRFGKEMTRIGKMWEDEYAKQLGKEAGDKDKVYDMDEII